ncbi:MAG: hypothetical protein LBI56_02795 [Puniceicoccales bacterium]|jgi:hypothetical protein|nr:hypothetical protein [Puniceicoccales bacterium]
MFSGIKENSNPLRTVIDENTLLSSVFPNELSNDSTGVYNNISVSQNLNSNFVNPGTGSGSNIRRSSSLMNRNAGLDGQRVTSQMSGKTQRKLTDRTISAVNKVKIGEYIVGFGLVGIGVGLLILNKVLPSNGDNSLQAVGSSLITGGVGLLLAPVQSKMIDALKKPIADTISYA